MFAVIDIETTGTSNQTGKIIEIAIILFNGQFVTESFVTLINPECYIPKFITNITGISNDMVTNAPRFYEIAKQIVQLTSNRIFVAHNVGFDYNFVRKEFKDLGYDYTRKTLCTVELSRKLLPGHASYSLGKLCNDLNIGINGRHRAEGDALATVELMKMILSKYELKVNGIFLKKEATISHGL
jgi:DNA polymerase-3 subunit epsilon